MDFFCIPVLFGCKETISPEGEQMPRFCPRCNNASVGQAKKRQWFEICFVPLIPMSSKHVWHCAICQWQVPSNQQWQPAVANGPPPGAYHGPPGNYGPPPNAPPPHGWQSPQQSGYYPQQH